MSQNDCAAVRSQMSAYLDGELDEAARLALLAHLEKCADCGTFFNTLCKTLRLYHALPDDALNADARARLQRALELDR